MLDVSDIAPPSSSDEGESSKWSFLAVSPEPIMIEKSPLLPDLEEPTDTDIETRLLSPVARCDNPQAQQIVTLSLQCIETQSM